MKRFGFFFLHRLSALIFESYFPNISPFKCSNEYFYFQKPGDQVSIMQYRCVTVHTTLSLLSATVCLYIIIYSIYIVLTLVTPVSFCTLSAQFNHSFMF